MVSLVLENAEICAVAIGFDLWNFGDPKVADVLIPPQLSRGERAKQSNE